MSDLSTEFFASFPESQGDEPSPTPAAPEFVCDNCGRACQGAPAATGLFIWTRGEETRYEEPPLCKDCSENLILPAALRAMFEMGEE